MRIGRLEVRLRSRNLRARTESVSPDAHLSYVCNVCGSRQRVPAGCLGRESVSCFDCESNVRFRAIVHLLTESLYGSSQVLLSAPTRKDLSGLGLSDWPGYAQVLAEKFSYRNTHFEREPRLDITEPGPAFVECCDFLISSDVFEHVLFPVQKAFDGAFRVLKPGGTLILTIPYTLDRECTEHYPGATGYSVRARDQQTQVTHPDGNYIARHPVFHGGLGSTLEMRTMSLSGVLNALDAAGFEDVQVRGESFLRFGVVHDTRFSLPIVARKPRAG